MSRITKSQKPETEESTVENEEGLDPALSEILKKERELIAAKRQVKYNFQKSQKKIHSLYKLEVAKFKKNTSYSGAPKWEEVEHCHFFHTIDAAGGPQTECAPVGGHFHVMELVSPGTEDTPPVYRCSPPMKRVRVKNPDTGRFEVKTVPANGVDNHIHTVTYKHSEIWSPSPVNDEFLKFQAAQARKIVNSGQFIEQ